MNTQPSVGRLVELMHLRPPGAAPFVLAVEPQHDRSIAPYMRGNAIWEPAETLLALRLLRPGMHAVDAGAHVGYYSVLFSQRVGSQGHVHAFEPEPDNYRLLSANLLLNDCRNVRAHRLALTERAGNESLYLSPHNLGDHRLLAVPGRHRVDIATTNLDSVLNGAPLDFVKIDTQGAELRVLAGMAATIRSHRERLACMMEFAPGLHALGGTSLERFAAELAALDVRAYTIALNGRNLVLRRLAPLQEGLQIVAAELAREGEVDASCDLFVTFGATAEQDWLARYRG